MNIALIIARAGSKRIKNKNIKSFYGKPIIAYSIIAALKSKIFKRVIISTENNKIINISKNFGAEIPFIRPKSLADDKTSTFKVIKHAIKILKLKKNDNLCCIYPVSPNVKKKLLQSTLKILLNKKADFVFPVAKKLNVNKPLYINANGYIRKTKLKKKNFLTDTGQFYWGKVRSFINFSNIFSGKSIGFKVSKEIFLDVNNMGDWRKLVQSFKNDKI